MSRVRASSLHAGKSSSPGSLWAAPYTRGWLRKVKAPWKAGATISGAVSIIESRKPNSLCFSRTRFFSTSRPSESELRSSISAA